MSDVHVEVLKTGHKIVLPHTEEDFKVAMRKDLLSDFSWSVPLAIFAGWSVFSFFMNNPDRQSNLHPLVAVSLLSFLVVVFVASLVGFSVYSLRSKVNRQARLHSNNLTSLKKQLESAFNIEIGNVTDFTAFTEGRHGFSELFFTSVDEETYSVRLLPNESNLFAVVHHLTEEIVSAEGQITTVKVDTVIRENTVTPKTFFGVKETVSFNDLVDGLIGEVDSERIVDMVSEIQGLIAQLDKCDLTVAENAGVDKVFDEFKEILILISQTVPVGFDEWSEELYVGGLTVVRNSLSAKVVSYRERLKTSMEEKIEMLKVLLTDWDETVSV